MHHYKECGLPDVWLVNGYKVRKTPYGKAIAIEDVEGLHKCIRELVERLNALDDVERFDIRLKRDKQDWKLAA